MVVPSSFRVDRRRRGAFAMSRMLVRFVFGSAVVTSLYLVHQMNWDALDPKLSSTVKDTDSDLPHPEYASRKERNGRRKRFPSVDERVRIYMGSWYTPPCGDNVEGKVLYQFVNDTETSNQTLLLVRELERNSYDKTRRMFVLSKNIRSARALYLDEGTIRACSVPDGKQGQRGYCLDVIEFMMPALKRSEEASRGIEATPTILQFGDSNTAIGFKNQKLEVRDQWPNFPIIKKFRAAYSGGMQTIREITKESCLKGLRTVHDTALGPAMSTENIIWRLTSKRHFGPVLSIPEADIPWEEKKDLAVFRGALTGTTRDGFVPRRRHDYNETETCQLMHRCRLVYNTAHSPLVDAVLTGPIRKVPKRIGDISLFGDALNRNEMLQFKAIIMLEGNDVASGFKWALFSNSVLMSQLPTKTSWAMEDILEPWVHYIPLNKNLTDVEEKMQWVIDNDEQARQIAYRGSLWMKDLLFHPDSARDEELIFDEMLRRYRAHFKPTTELQLPVLK